MKSANAIFISEVFGLRSGCLTGQAPKIVGHRSASECLSGRAMKKCPHKTYHSHNTRRDQRITILDYLARLSIETRCVSAMVERQMVSRAHDGQHVVGAGVNRQRIASGYFEFAWLMNAGCRRHYPSHRRCTFHVSSIPSSLLWRNNAQQSYLHARTLDRVRVPEADVKIEVNRRGRPSRLGRVDRVTDCGISAQVISPLGILYRTMPNRCIAARQVNSPTACKQQY